MRPIQKLVLVLLSMFLIASCGSSSDQEQAGTAADRKSAGTVMTQAGPVINAVVTVKTWEGEVVGSATTNTQGEYKVAVRQNGLFMAEAKDPSGKVLFGIGQDSNMNITHLGDFLIRLWYQAKGSDVAMVFGGLSPSSPMPYIGELTVVANQIVTVPANALGKPSAELFGSEMTSTLAKIIQGTTIVSPDQLKISLPEVQFSGTYSLKASAAKNGTVLYEGTEETASVNVPAKKGSIKASVGEAKSKNSGNLRVRSGSGASSNEHWMKDNWEYIKDKKIAELVIPGTHDSGTYDLAPGLPKVTAMTQINSIGDQLKDGIRYFDLRVREASHRGCADPSVWWLFHTWDSYRLHVALDEIQAFISKPGNENEVIVLDFQKVETVYDDARALDVLLGLIEDKLGGVMVKTVTDKNAKESPLTWQTSTMTELVDKKQRVIVLIQGSVFDDTRQGCRAGVVDMTKFARREPVLISAYKDHLAEDYQGIQTLITSELDPTYMDDEIKKLREKRELELKAWPPESLQWKAIKWKYDLLENAIANNFSDSAKYKKFQTENKLRVMQLAARPSDWWYVTPSLDGLLGYATRKINKPLNFNEAGSGCPGGWLGKRLRMGVEGDPDKWNAPNIIMADNYLLTEWVLPDYRNGQWIASQKGRYVDMAIALNRIDRKARRLIDVREFSDGQCLH